MSADNLNEPAPQLVAKVPNKPFSRMLDEDVIRFALIECAFVSETQLICVVCFARAPGIPLTIDIIRVFSPFYFFLEGKGGWGEGGGFLLV